ncbi:MAG: hypothetical protein A2Z25_05260 [Planctomycetes bacterium RBG_16_55_9]|nr:MAG: hypothetical protein A2Z25_05260 [Planctomycetes bacterium RBG_16_55_9]
MRKESMMKKYDLLTVCLTLFAIIGAMPICATASPAAVRAAWLFDEGGGATANDSSGFDITGAIVGDAEWILGNNAMFGSALKLEDGEYVDIGEPTPDVLLVEQDITLMVWFKPHQVLAHWQVLFSMQRGSSGGEAYAMTYGNNNDQIQAIFNTAGGNGNVQDPAPLVMNEWVHAAATYDGQKAVLYRNGQPVAENTTTFSGQLIHENRSGRFAINGNYNSLNGGLREHASCTLDEVLIFDEVLTQEQIENIMELGFLRGSQPRTTAFRPDPPDGAIHESTWVTLGWSAGAFAASHDVYLGDDFDSVNEATRDSDVFRGNQTTDFYVAGFPGFAYPDGLVGGTTYYWRIDEVNEADPNSPWKGDIWSFSIPPKTAYNPDPADGNGAANTAVTLSWTAGFGAKLHTVYFGQDYDTVANASAGVPLGTTSYNPGALQAEKVYYWRVDEFDGFGTYKGDVWTFTAPGAVGNPKPANGASDLAMATTLSWTAATNAASHQVYLGLDKQAVRSADTPSPEYKGSRTLGAESYDAGLLEANTTYYWRVDEVYNGNPVKGPVWTFTVGAYLLVEDFESYTDDDAAGQAIWQNWIDGFGVADNGAQVGYLLPPYAERTIVHGGSQSMPLLYVNEAGVTNSEAALTLATQRDWTVVPMDIGIGELSLWFRGTSANAAEPLYVAISNPDGIGTGSPAVVAYDDPSSVAAGVWKQWRIPLQAFTNKGINLSNVNKIAVGLGSKSGLAAPGGTGTIYVDDIRLYQP